MTTPNKWHSFWHGKILEGEQIEVFISPEGRWYVRAGKDEAADYEHQPKIKGLPVLRLKNVDHWRPLEDQPKAEAVSVTPEPIPQGDSTDAVPTTEVVHEQGAHAAETERTADAPAA